MIVEQVWTGNAYRNFNYLVACEESGEALAIDPLDFTKCLDVAQERGWTITQILNTHEHADHTGGNKGVVNATGAKIIAHKDAGERIPNMDRGVGAGDARRTTGLLRLLASASARGGQIRRRQRILAPGRTRGDLGRETHPRLSMRMLAERTALIASPWRETRRLCDGARRAIAPRAL